MCACNPNPWEWEKGSEVQGHPQVCREFTASLGYMRPCQKERGEVREEQRERGRKKKKRREKERKEKEKKRKGKSRV